MRLVDDPRFERGVRAIRERFDVPDGFPAPVRAEAEQLARRSLDDPDVPRVDRTAMRFVTLDPVGSTDLDQAFAIESSGRDLLLHYAIADVGWFVRPGSAVDAEAWRRGVTLYLPDGRAGLHPPQLAEGAASLLPDGDRPAVVFSVRIDVDGTPRLEDVERAIVRSRAQLAYATATAEDLPAGFVDLAERVERNERARGADRIDVPEQEVEQTDAGVVLRFRPRRRLERQGAAMSLATNIAVAETLHAAGTGLFRTMPAVDESGERRLRHTARAFGLDWPNDRPLAAFEPTLPRDDPRTAAFQFAVRRASGRASYEPFDPGNLPWHAAVAATYTHATAPLRRLVDRYVVEAALATARGNPLDAAVVDAFDRLPEVMERATSRSNQIDRAVVDLAESVVLAGREGEVFDAVVTDEDDRGARVQVREPAIVGRVVARRVDPGDEVRVKLVRADPGTGTIEFERVG